MVFPCISNHFESFLWDFYRISSVISMHFYTFVEVKKSRTALPLDEIEQEILIMRQIDHPHMVRLFEWYEDATRVYLVLDYLQGGSLKDVIVQLNRKDERGLKEAWIREVIQQSAGGLAYCHNLRLIHKDLKDENIMLLEKPVP